MARKSCEKREEDKSKPHGDTKNGALTAYGAVVAIVAALAIAGLASGETFVSGKNDSADWRWQSSDCGEIPSLESGDSAHFRKVFQEEDLAIVHAAQAEARRQTYKLDYERSFGYEASDVKGHNVTFLHTVFFDVALGIAQKLYCLTMSAQKQRGWGLDAVASQLQPRVVELITYDSDRATTGSDSNLGWHSDLGSLLTTAVALSSRSSYEGGAFELRHGASPQVIQAATDVGDVLIWRGWDPHRVAPVTSGRRQVLVIEWWLGPMNRNPQMLRGVHAGKESLEHKAKSYETAVSIDPANPIAQLNLATHLAEDRSDSLNAELGFRKALKLAPSHALAHLKLGKLLKLQKRSAEAIQSMRAASALEPASADFALIAAVTAASANDANGVPELQAAIRLAPEKAKTHYTVAAALASLDKISDARYHLSKALSLEPTHTDALALDISLGLLDTGSKSRSSRREANVNANAPASSSAERINARNEGRSAPKTESSGVMDAGEVVTRSIDAVDSLKISELKEELGKLGLPRSGSRETLQNRLKEALARTEVA